MNLSKYLFIFGLFYSPVLSAEAIICIENEAYPPSINGTHTLPTNNPGYSIEIAQTAAKRANLSIEFIRRPWARCLQLVSSGRIDGLLPSIKTYDRQQQYSFPQEDELFLSKADYHIFYHAEDHNAHFYEKLVTTENKSALVQEAKLKYGIAAPYGYIAYKMLQQFNLLASHDYALDKGLKMVANKKLDGYVVIKTIGEHKAEILNIRAKLKITKQPFLQERLYIVFNHDFYKSNKSKIDAFWQELPTSRLEILGY